MMRTAAALLLFTLVAARLEAAATLEGVNLGTFVTGPSVTVQDLRGHVVLFEYWGVHCPPCLASIEHLAAMQKRFGRDNFIIIANHCQGEPAAMVQSTWQSKGGGSDVSVVMDGDLPGSNVTGIPHCFLFDVDHKLIYDGSPFDVEEHVADAVKASPGALVVGHTFTKLVREAAAVGAMDGNLAGALRSIRKASGGSDEAAKSDADFLLDRITTFTTDALTRIQGEEATDPLDCGERLMRMVSLFKGDDLGKPFVDLAKQLKADKAFQARLNAADMLSQIEAAAAKIGLGSDPDAHRHSDDCQNILGGLQTLIKKYPQTPAADKARALISDWNL